MEEGISIVFRKVTEYDDGTIDQVMTRKLSEISQLESKVEDEGPSRDRMILLRYLIEDTMLYNMVRQLISSGEDEFEDVLKDVLPAFSAELEDVPRSVVDNYRRGITEEQLLLEDRAMSYVDDIKGILTGTCRY